MKIFIVEGESFYVPGRPMTAHATKESANAEAASLTNILRQEVDLPTDATAEDWEAKCLEARQKSADDAEIDLDDLDEGDVWITELELHGYEPRGFSIAPSVLKKPENGGLAPDATAGTDDPMNLRGSCEDPRLAQSGYIVCGSNMDRDWHWHGPDGKWHDGYKSEGAAVNAALRDIESLKGSNS